jgi:hypothetical protein
MAHPPTPHYPVYAPRKVSMKVDLYRVGFGSKVLVARRIGVKKAIRKMAKSKFTRCFYTIRKAKTKPKD